MLPRYRIGPFEVESALIEHPAVVEAAVVSSPDPVRGEVKQNREKCKRNTLSTKYQLPYKCQASLEFSVADF